MSAEVKLHDILAAAASVVAVVGDRIYNKFVPESADLPAISFIREATEYVNTIHGAGTESVVTFDIYCVALDDAGAESLGDLVAAIVPTPPANMVKVNRVAVYDSEEDLHAAVITVNVDP